MLIASGMRAPVTAHLRNEIWVKILGNVAFNPISALTGAVGFRYAYDAAIDQFAHPAAITVLARRSARTATA
jgi:ketopantoate reductase